MSKNSKSGEFILKFICFVIALVVLVIAIMGIVKNAEAATDMHLRWEQPLFYDDGTEMSLETIANFELHYTVDKEFEITEQPVIIKAGETGTYVLPLNLAPRPDPYTVKVALRTVSIYGVRSDISNIISESFLVNSTAKPSAPVNIKFEFKCDKTCEIILVDITPPT